MTRLISSALAADEIRFVLDHEFLEILSVLAQVQARKMKKTLTRSAVICDDLNCIQKVSLRAAARA